MSKETPPDVVRRCLDFWRTDLYTSNGVATPFATDAIIRELLLAGYGIVDLDDPEHKEWHRGANMSDEQPNKTLDDSTRLGVWWREGWEATGTFTVDQLRKLALGGQAAAARQPKPDPQQVGFWDGYLQALAVVEMQPDLSDDLAKAETTVRMIKEWCGSVSTHDGRVKVDDILAIIDSGVGKT